MAEARDIIVYSTKPSAMPIHSGGMVVNPKWKACKFCKLKFPKEDDIDTGTVKGFARRRLLRHDYTNPAYTHIKDDDSGLCNICATDAIDEMHCTFCSHCQDHWNEDCKTCEELPPVMIRPIYEYSELLSDCMNTYACSTCFFKIEHQQEATKRVHEREQRMFYPLQKYETIQFCRLCYQENVSVLIPPPDNIGKLSIALRVREKCYSNPKTYHEGLVNLTSQVEKELQRAEEARAKYHIVSGDDEKHDDEIIQSRKRKSVD